MSDLAARPEPSLQLQAWLQAVAEQDAMAFEQLYRQLAPRVHALALRILRNAACAEDVVEDCFWQIWRQAARFDPLRGSAEAWVMTLARSRALDAWRARQRSDGELISLDLLSEDGQTPHEVAQPDHSEQGFESRRQHQALHAALAQLQPLPRQLVALAFLRGLTHEEIAEQTGLALGTVKSHIRRSLGLLNTALQASASSTS